MSVKKIEQAGRLKFIAAAIVLLYLGVLIASFIKSSSRKSMFSSDDYSFPSTQIGSPSSDSWSYDGLGDRPSNKEQLIRSINSRNASFYGLEDDNPQYVP